ncbi:hypothetical protein QH494_02515 [Sphingomonas sp. AR_OL41]|uniref:hypothetical protein n=1 Tax=Sphingomonas sp. AR_OL41 TaxID=3042729 RepID=UPI002480A8A9|nr:hypothetical protein [Sphingomonas sp. AR_OL41]MDH7971042.1 hypothetical protein [Sphingomonas sp. AR_OL41]
MSGIKLSVSVYVQDSIKDMVADVRAKLVGDLHKALVLATPVDTGRARLGWVPDLAAGTIENNVEYIEALNAGHSKQAPAGYVENTIDAVTRL